jgi:phosphoribosylformimino-5-aminoimidazole carboxamide ribotide isomerase
MIIFPAIDVLNNQVVRLKKGDYTNVTVYNDSVIDQIHQFETQGATWIHLVDLQGARSGQFSLLPLIQTIKHTTKLNIQCGGGIRSLAMISSLLDAGVDRLVIGSYALQHLAHIKTLCQQHANQIVIAVDSHQGYVAYDGWTKTSAIRVIELLPQLESIGVRHILLTDISKDGMLSGVDASFYQALCTQFPSLHFIASGGIASIDDVKQLAKTDVKGAIVGVALYEKKITLHEALSC